MSGFEPVPAAPALFAGRPLYHGSPRAGLTVLRADLPLARRFHPADPHTALGVYFAPHWIGAEPFARTKPGRPPGVVYEPLAPPRTPRRLTYDELREALGEDQRRFPVGPPGTPHYERLRRAIAAFRRAMLAHGHDSLACRHAGRPEAAEIIYLVDVPVRPAPPPPPRAQEAVAARRRLGEG